MLNTIKTTALAAAVGMFTVATGAQALTINDPTPGNSAPYDRTNPLFYTFDLVALGFTSVSSVSIFDDGDGSTSGATSGFDVDGIGLFDLDPGGPLDQPEQVDRAFDTVSDGTVADVSSFDFDATASNFPSTGDGGSFTATFTNPVTVALGSNQFLFIQDVSAADELSSIVIEGTVIPLPAGVWLLLSALGGFAVLSRRRKTA